MRQRFGIEAELIKGRNGVFEVHLDGEPIFSKYEIGRFPHQGEVEDILEQRTQA